MIHLLKRWSLASVFVLTLISFSCTENGSDVSPEHKAVRKFFELREAGNTGEAWKMLSEKSRRIFSRKEFDEYAFIYKVSEIIDIKESDGYFKVSYNYYDKKYKKNSEELYTFYITENVENLKVEQTGIIFPYTGYFALRKAIEKKDMNEVNAVVKKMLQVDSGNPDVVKSAEQMGVRAGH